MQAIIDEETCTGCGLCVDICPEVFELSDDKAVVIAETTPSECENSCREAVESCPVEAITIKE